MTSQLQLLALLLGIVLIAKHLLGLLVPNFCKKILSVFPRSRSWGTLFIGIAGLWTLILTATTDLGEFSSLRPLMLVAIFLGSILFWYFVPDFLAVRSLGFLMLLLGHALLEVTFLKSGFSAILLSLLAYIWILAAFFFIGMPYLFRNFITTLSKPHYAWLWSGLACGGLFYGLLLAVAAGWALLVN
jgi:hypothetical protein